jgi:hypothetical protein
MLSDQITATRIRRAVSGGVRQSVLL